MTTYTGTAKYKTSTRSWTVELSNGEAVNLHDVDTAIRFVVLADVVGGYWWGTEFRYADRDSAELVAAKLAEIPHTKVVVVELADPAAPRR